jgi:hypothetical protein
MILKITIKLVAVLFSIIANTCLYSQNVFDIRTMSMGNTSVSNSYDLDAFNQNPANILNQRINNNSLIYFNFFTNAGMFTNSDYLSLDFYDDYFTKDDNGNTRYLNDNDKANIISEASDQQSNYLASAKILSFIYNTKNIGTFGLSIDERTNGNFIPSKDFLELGLYGNEVNRVYNLSDNEINAYWIRELNITYARKLELKKNNVFDQVSFGASVKPQFGLYYLNTQSNDLTIFTNDSNTIQSAGRVEFLYAGLTDNNEFKYSLGNAGFGFGFDIGVNARLKNVSKNGYVNIGLSVTDLGYIKWNKNTNSYYNDGSFIITDITEQSQIDSLKDIIKGTKTPVPDFTTSLSPTLRLGASYKIINRNKNDSLRNELATIAIDYVQGLNDDLGGTTKPIIGIGGEYNASKVLSPRLGFAFGGLQNFAMSIGLGINAGPVIIDLGTYNIASIFEPRGTTKFSMGIGIKFKVL